MSKTAKKRDKHHKTEMEKQSVVAKKQAVSNTKNVKAIWYMLFNLLVVTMKPFPMLSNSKSIYKQQALVFGLALVVAAPSAKSGINLTRCL